MKKPDFFIIGAPKCGTTSLAAWLAEHPHVFMSPRKEPHHFNTDMKNYLTRSRSLYERLFSRAGDQHLAVGEASTWYLYSDVAVPNILEYNPDARFVVCLRNPVEMAPSLHEQCRFAAHEHIADFAAAWALRDERHRGRAVSFWCREPKQLSYGRACLLGSMLERLYQRVPREKVLTILLDDMRANPGCEYRRVLEFLGVADDRRAEFPVENAAKEPRYLLGQQIARIGYWVKLRTGITRSFGLARLNTRPRPRAPLAAELVPELEEYFRADIARLEALLGRDLSHWFRANGRRERHAA
jgi:hypothetical protein